MLIFYRKKFGDCKYRIYLKTKKPQPICPLTQLVSQFFRIHYACTGLSVKCMVPADGTILGGCGNCRRWGLFGGSKSLGVDLCRLYSESSAFFTLCFLFNRKCSCHHDVLFKCMSQTNIDGNL
jgi:hypothetical protein